MVAATYPPVTAATIEEIRLQRTTMERDPERMVSPVDLVLPNRYIFRTYPGTVRAVLHDIPAPPVEALDDKKTVFMAREWKRRMVKQFKDPAKPNETDDQIIKRAEKYYASVTTANDEDSKIRFNRISRRQECYFATDNPTLAAYIRDLVKRKVGEFEFVYEVNGKARIVVGPETEHAKSFPNTKNGREAAHQYAAEHNIAGMLLVED